MRKPKNRRGKTFSWRKVKEITSIDPVLLLDSLVEKVTLENPNVSNNHYWHNNRHFVWEGHHNRFGCRRKRSLCVSESLSVLGSPVTVQLKCKFSAVQLLYSSSVILYGGVKERLWHNDNSKWKCRRERKIWNWDISNSSETTKRKQSRAWKMSLRRKSSRESGSGRSLF